MSRTRVKNAVAKRANEVKHRSYHNFKHRSYHNFKIVRERCLQTLQALAVPHSQNCLHPEAVVRENSQIDSIGH